MKYKDKSMRFWKNIVRNAHSSLLAFALVILTIFGFSGREIKKNEDAYKELEKLTDILTLIENNYVEEVNIDNLFLGAINGMMDTLDSHSSFIPS
jgi:carboxyl-terminal processing protease